MKKILTAMLSGLMAVSMFASCSGGGSGSSTPASSGSSGSSETSVSASESASAEESASESSCEELSGERLNDILDAGVITLVTSPDFAPLEFEDISSGETVYAGSDIELAKYIADYLGVELEIQAMDFQACQAAIATGQADMMISGCAPTEERRRTMELSDPYNTSSDDGQLLIVPLDMVSTYNSAESFAGKTIACQNGSLQYNLTSEQLPDAEIQIIGSLGDGVLMVDNGRVDAMACSGDTAKMYVENYPDLGIAEWQFDYTSEGNVVLCQKGETALLAQINAAIAQVVDQGLYDTWREDATELARSLGLEVNE